MRTLSINGSIALTRGTSSLGRSEVRPTAGKRCGSTADSEDLDAHAASVRRYAFCDGTKEAE